MATDNEMLAQDAKTDQILAAAMEGIRSDIDGFGRLLRKINRAADTRQKCVAERWTTEEMFHLVRLAHAGSAILTGRLLGRDV